MSTRAESAGDMTAVRGKIAARYDPEVEAEVRGWIQALLGEAIPTGMREVERYLRNGQTLVKLAAKIRDGTPNLPNERCRRMKLKYNTLSAPFKQMENIQVFLSFAEQYGVKKTSLFQTVDLYEGRNMAQVLSCIQQLGTECQRHGFNGPTIGMRPIEEHHVLFTQEQRRAGHGIIGLQMGTNKLASQKGMTFAGVRHGADIRCDDLRQEGCSDVSLQAGTNKFASQKGMSFGAVRHGADIRADDSIKESMGELSLQAGTNKFASQKGMVMGGVRHCADIRADDLLQEGNDTIGLQAGTNKYASQKGMVMGGVRHCADIRADDSAQEGQGVIGLQAGSNQFASQKGTRGFGAVRHIADIRAEGGDQATIGLQMGTNQFANQSGLSMGAPRPVTNPYIESLGQDVEGQGMPSLQYGMPAPEGAGQSGMSYGAPRDIAGQPM